MAAVDPHVRLTADFQRANKSFLRLAFTSPAPRGSRRRLVNDMIRTQSLAASSSRDTDGPTRLATRRSTRSPRRDARTQNKRDRRPAVLIASRAPRNARGPSRPPQRLRKETLLV